MKKNNGFLLEDALFAFFVILVCASLVLNGIYTLYFQRNLKIDEKIEKNLEVLPSMVLDKAIDDYRYEILDFCSALSNGRKYNRESFNHIFSVYEKYEKILKENNMENGLVEESIKFIREKYNGKLKNCEFN